MFRFVRRPAVRRPLALGIAAAVAACIAGCPSLESLPNARSVQEDSLPRSGRNYLLYVPSTYRAGRRWPLVILCHGTIPYDTPDLQMREWASFAERQGIIVAAPTLEAVQGDFPPPQKKQLRLQNEDEQAILELVAELKHRYEIGEERVFMAGWSAGAYAIFHTGLKHPEIFRALYIRQGTFDARFMDVPEERLDRWQAIKITYGHADLLRDQARAAVAWMRERKLYVDEEETTGAHRRTAARKAWDYFKDIAKNRLWVRIRAAPPDVDAPLTLQFAADCVPAAARRKWFFGDGGESHEATPTHTYERPGRYEVVVNVALINGKKYARRRFVEAGLIPE